MPEHNPPTAPGAAQFDRLMEELRRARPVQEERAPRQMEVTVRVELSDEAAKFIQVAGVSIDELGV